MNFRLVASIALIAAGAATALGFAARSDNPTPSPAPALEVSHQADHAFKVDPVHSSVMFRIEHMGVCNFYGAFRDVSGSYTLGDNASFEVSVKTDSVDSRNKGRDDHLKSPDFFNAAEFPAIAFKSTKVEKNGEGFKVTGDLTLHGVTKSITVDMKTWAPKETRQGVKSGVEGSFTIKRSDYGMTTYVAEGGLGDEVDIVVALEGAAAKE
jgi:polyisoprenoid-binding protein YceI